MSTYLTHGGAERERVLAALWASIEVRVERREQIRIADLRPGLATRCHGWHEDEQSLVFAFSGHAYHRVMVAVERIAEELEGGTQTGKCDRGLMTAAENLDELRIAYCLLQTSRRLADELSQLEGASEQRGLARWARPA